MRTKTKKDFDQDLLIAAKEACDWLTSFIEKDDKPDFGWTCDVRNELMEKIKRFDKNYD